MTDAHAEARADALAFLKRHKTGVLATVSPQGRAQARMVYYTADDDFNIYFLTLANTRKHEALQHHPEAAFVVSTPDVPQTIQIEGAAMDITLDPDAAPKKQALFDVLNSNPWFYGPITKLDPADVIVMWLKPAWVRWADYAFAESGSQHVLREIPLT